jgi:glycosyltransferase involved in cell wall biosynthesis
VTPTRDAATKISKKTHRTIRTACSYNSPFSLTQGAPIEQGWYGASVLLGATVVVVVPAYDERPRIARVLATTPAWVDRIVVVDDASHDGTADAARGVGDPRVEVIVHARNRGVGASIVTGYRRALELTRAPNDALTVMAGDGQMDPCDLEALVRPVATGRAGYVKGNRFAWPHAHREMPPSRWIAGQVLSLLTARAIGSPVHDSQCGYTAMSRKTCERLDLSEVWPGYGYPNDLLGQLVRRGVTIEEVPVRPVYADEVSRLRPRHGLTVLWLVGRAWVRSRAQV